ncbi:MAG: HAD family hydrolase [Clostridiales Family XIII bacterium]|jgi:D-glycero-D-manno-heptose 1,7-bisphosphate phosphatase|nr:HAD family hydrolase [Clostridiales Family XIII bacterium]
MRVIFLDRDGVINEACPPGLYVLSEDDFKFVGGSIEAIVKLKKKGYKIVVVTNQRSIFKGLLSEKKLEDIHKKMLKKIESSNGKIDKIYYCPHDKNSCNCRKPKTGMFEKAEKEFGKIDKENSFMIGDDPNDILAGRNFGVKTIFIRNDIYSQENLEKKADYKTNSLLEAANLIISTSP